MCLKEKFNARSEQDKERIKIFSPAGSRDQQHMVPLEIQTLLSLNQRERQIRNQAFKYNTCGTFPLFTHSLEVTAIY